MKSYVVQSLVEEIPLSRATKCRLLQDQPPFLVVPKRKGIDIYQIVKHGLEPKYTIPFQKTVFNLHAMAGKLLAQPSTTDLLLVIFYDFSFIVFTDPSHILFSYQPETNMPIKHKFTDLHPNKPYLIFPGKFGTVRFWDGSPEHQKNVYDLKIDNNKLLDAKFLWTSNTSIACLYKLPTHKRGIIVHQLNIDLLNMTRVDSLCVEELEDDTTCMLIAIPNGPSDRPTYLALGSKLVTFVRKGVVRTIDSPFKNDAIPISFCQVAGSLYLVGDNSGHLFIMDVKTTPEFTAVGSVPTVPSSLLHIDGNIFYIGSQIGNALYIKVGEKVEILNEIKQFPPINDVSLYSEEVGAIFMSHGGYIGDNGLTLLRTGASFTETAEIEVAGVDSVIPAGNKRVIINIGSNRSEILVADGTFSLLNLNGFDNTKATIAAVPKDKDSFYQVYDKGVNLVGTESLNLTCENEIIDAAGDGKQLYLLYDDLVECLGPLFMPIFQTQVDTGSVKIAAAKDYIAVANWNGSVSLLINDEIASTVQATNSLICGLHFVSERGGGLRLMVACENGSVVAYSLPLMQKVGEANFGHLISSSFEVSHNSIFITGSSPAIVYSDLTSIPAIVGDKFRGCCAGKDIVFISREGVSLGRLDESNVCKTDTVRTESTPLLLALHQFPPSLFTSVFKDGLFGLEARSLPSMELIFQHTLGEDIEVTALEEHESMEAMLFGTAGRNEGFIYIVRTVLGEMRVVAELQFEGGIFALKSAGEMIFAGGRNRLFAVRSRISAAGAATLEVVQSVVAPTVCRALSVCGNSVVHFDAMRSISVFSLNEENILIETASLMVPGDVRCGVVGPMVGENHYHAFCGDANGVIRVLSIRTGHKPSVEEVGTAKLGAAIDTMVRTREGFVVVTTQDGGVCAIMDVPRDTVRLLRRVSENLEPFLPVQPERQQVVDMSVVGVFTSFPTEVQTTIATNSKSKPQAVLEAIRAIRSRTARLCSTLQ